MQFMRSRFVHRLRSLLSILGQVEVVGSERRIPVGLVDPCRRAFHLGRSCHRRREGHHRLVRRVHRLVRPCLLVPYRQVSLVDRPCQVGPVDLVGLGLGCQHRRRGQRLPLVRACHRRRLCLLRREDRCHRPCRRRPLVLVVLPVLVVPSRRPCHHRPVVLARMGKVRTLLPEFARVKLELRCLLACHPPRPFQDSHRYPLHQLDRPVPYGRCSKLRQPVAEVVVGCSPNAVHALP